MSLGLFLCRCRCCYWGTIVQVLILVRISRASVLGITISVAFDFFPYLLKSDNNNKRLLKLDFPFAKKKFPEKTLDSLLFKVVWDLLGNSRINRAIQENSQE